jgi:hypothetical protein
LTHLYLGYVAVENDPINPPVYLVCNNEAGAVAWNIPLNRRTPPPGGLLIPFVPPTAPTPDAPRRIRVRPSAAKKTENE